MERELVLLGLLNRQQMHGYELHEFIENNLQMCINLKKPTAYYLLEKLEKRGYITQTEERQGNRPPRRIYHLSETGKAYYQQLLQQNLSSYLPARFGGSIGVAFLDDVDRKTAVSLLKQRHQQLSQSLSDAQQIPDHPGAFQYLIDHQRVHLQSELDWLDKLIQTIEKG
ncbi:MAG: PadR family transcriptional regulator [Chloroflexi bacterium]|nr:MAG: PadR family transcriptional regulator [Chloroflexota bacterium]